jgi:hypothetical protein
MFQIQYDNRFDNVAILDVAAEECVRDRLPSIANSQMPMGNFVTPLAELEDTFKVSRYQLSKLLDQIRAEPCGEIYNYNSNGTRKRGVGKVVYNKTVVDEIEKLTSAKVDVAAMKAKALAILQADSGI